MHGTDAKTHEGVLRIFISYRRQDAPSYARELYHELSAHFKDSQIFWDIKMELGVDFVKEIERAVGSCDVLVAVIGPNWLTMKDEKGQRRLDDPSDFVRLEIATALDRNIRVNPVLVHAASMPSADDLPDPLQRLSRRSAIELSDKRWEFDVGELIASLHRVPYQKLVPPTGRGPFPTDDRARVGVATGETPQSREPAPATPSPAHVVAAQPRSVPLPSPTVASGGGVDTRMLGAAVLLGLVLVAVFLVTFAYSRSLGAGGSPGSDSGTPVAAAASAATSAPAVTATLARAATRAPAVTPASTSVRGATATPADTAVNYADELTDFGVAPLFVLQTPDRIGSPTPLSVPGGTVVTTGQLARAMQQSSANFVLIDALAGPAHATIPGAETVPEAGSSGTFSDSVQQMLDDYYAGLTDSMDTSMVFFCQGARCWESYNASLRAIHMGYTHVYWYRGGLAASQAAGLPFTNP